MSLAEQLVNKINEFRTNPKGYAKKINEYVKYFKGKTLRIPGSNAGIRTEEGAEAYIEAAEFLANKDGVDPLEPSKGLARICEDFMAEAQKVDPNELGNIDLEEIIAKYGEFSGSLNRAMDFGGEDPEQVLINLIVCDGDSERGNRESLLSTELKRIGVATAKHPTYRYCTLIISCTKFDNNVDSDDYGFINSGSSSYAEKKPKPASKPARGGEGNTLKPRKVVLKQKPVEQTPPPQNDEEEDDVPPEGVVSESRSEKIITEKGKKKRIIKIVRTMVDGSKETETIKEPVEDDD
jgi:hypothetical protein